MTISCTSTGKCALDDVAGHDREIVALYSETAETAMSIVALFTETITEDIHAPVLESAEVSRKVDSEGITTIQPKSNRLMVPKVLRCK